MMTAHRLNPKLTEDDLLDTLVEVIYTHINGLPAQECCDTLGLTPTAVVKRLYRMGRHEWAKPYNRLKNEASRKRLEARRLELV